MYFTEQNFLNDYTLNIFTDASTRTLKGGRVAGCYGAVAMIGRNIIDQDFRIATESTSNNSEIKGVRLGVDLAIKHRNEVQVINLFSDSQISIFGIRDRIFNWRLSNGVLRGSQNAEIQSQEIFIQIMTMIVNNNININFYHQKGHVNTRLFDSVNNAAHVFCSSNQVRELVDLNFIKFISDMNNYVDKHSRDNLYKVKNINQLNIRDPIKYDPFNYRETLRRYNELMGGKYYV